MFYSHQRSWRHVWVGLAAVVKVSTAHWGQPPPAPPVPFTRWDSWGHSGHRWGTASVPATCSTWVCASTKKEQGLLRVSGYGAVLGKYIQTCGVQGAVFVISGINYALQMVMQSFVTQRHENRTCQVSPSVGWSPGSCRAGLSRELALGASGLTLVPVSAHVSIHAHLPDYLLAPVLGISYNGCQTSSRLLKDLF